jgi:nucleoid-associated protein YgaU
VQDGDTIWSIVYNIYGDVSRIDQFYALNSSVLGTPDNLRVGMELRVPPIE